MRTPVVALFALAPLAFALLAASAGTLPAPRTAATARTSAPRADAAHPPAVQLLGHDSKIDRARFQLVTDAQTWRALWAEHTGRPVSYTPPDRHDAPEIDFSRFMVVAAFAGEITSTDALRAVDVTRGADALRIRYEPSTYQTALAPPAPNQPAPNRPAPATPFGLWIVERTDAPVLIERAARDGKDAPARWEPVWRSDAP
jgi:hypothetical protein